LGPLRGRKRKGEEGIVRRRKRKGKEGGRGKGWRVTPK